MLMNAQVLPTIATHRRLVVSRMVRWFVPAKKVMLEMVDNAQVNFINTQAKSIDNACLKKKNLTGYYSLRKIGAFPILTV